MSWDGLVFSVIGRFDEGQEAVIASLEERGARAHNSLRQDAQFLLSGGQSGYAEERAAILGMRVLEGDLARDVITGAITREQFDERIAELEEREQSAPTLETNEFIERLRPMVHGEELARRKEVVEMLDEATPEAQRVACHYLKESPWGERYMRMPERFNHISASKGDFYGIPPHWKRDILAGVDAPKYALLRIASFNSDNLGNKSLMNLFECPSLHNVELLDLEANKTGVGFMKKLANSPQFDSLEFISFSRSKVTKSMLKPLIEREGLPHLAMLDIDGNVPEDALDLVCAQIPALGVSVLSLPRGAKLDRERIEGMLSDESLDTLSLVDASFSHVDVEALLDRIEQVGTSEHSPVYLCMSYSNRELRDAYDARFSGEERIRLVWGHTFVWPDRIAIARGTSPKEVIEAE